MADKTYRLKFDMSDGTQLDAGTITAPQGPEGPQGPQGEAPTEGPLDPNAKTGNPVTLRDQWQGYPFGVKVNVEPVQSGSGDPSPSNVRPIVVPNPVTVERRTGKNLFDADAIYGEFKQSDGTFAGDVGLIHSKNRHFKPSEIGKTLTFSAAIKPNADNAYVSVYAKINGADNYGTYANTSGVFATSQLTFIPQSTSDFINITYASGITITVKDVMLEEGSYTAYEPYQGDTYTVNLPADFGGGTVDMTRGMLKKEKIKVVLTENTPLELYVNTGEPNCFYFPNILPTSENYASYISSHFHPINLEIWVGVTGNTLYLMRTPWATVEEMRGYLQQQNANGTPVTFVYTPSVPQVSEIPAVHIPALPGTNVLTTNGTSLEVSQRQGQPDLNEMLLRRIAALEAAATGI